MKLYVYLIFLIIANLILISHQLDCRGEPRLRKFTLAIEMLNAMGPACGNCPIDITHCLRSDCISADGRERPLITVNKIMPGKIIEVCEGDTVVVEVKNYLKGISTTLNFHGQEQKDTPYEDGVPFVTQCPIQYGNTWIYKFVANNFGTHIYGSHSGFQFTNGFFGPLIVKRRRDPSRKMYDVDKHVLMLQDYLSNLAETYYPGNVDLGTRGQLPSNVLINGRGFYLDPEIGDLTGVPLTVLTVEENKKYRIRIMNVGTLECPLKLQIEEHLMTVIATDGTLTKPIKDVDTLTIHSGERYDVVVDADQTVNPYVIQVTALGACEQFGIMQQAILCYKGAICPNPPLFVPITLPENKVINPVGFNCDIDDETCYTAAQLEAQEEFYKCGRGDRRARKFHLKFNHHDFEPSDILTGVNNRLRNDPFYIPAEGDLDIYHMRAGQINKISNKMPPFPILSDPEGIRLLMDRNRNYRCKRDRSSHQQCLHVIQVDVGETVDIVLEHDETNQEDKSFPFELHGHKFCLLYQGHSLTEALDAKTRSATIMKDTVVVPGSGFTRIRFVANNPGAWLLHSQNIFDHITGMSIILSVGSESNLPELPIDFPTCGNYENLCEGGLCGTSDDYSM